MKSILNFIDKWGGRISFLLIVIVFFKTCTTNTRVERVEKNLTTQIKNIDSTVNVINLKTISTDDMEDLIKTTPFWKSLELEEYTRDMTNEEFIEFGKKQNRFRSIQAPTKPATKARNLGDGLREWIESQAHKPPLRSKRASIWGPGGMKMLMNMQRIMTMKKKNRN